MSSGFPTRSETNRAVRHKMAKALKFWIQKVGELCYLCSENIGTVSLLLYVCKKLVFS